MPKTPERELRRFVGGDLVGDIVSQLALGRVAKLVGRY
jgi:hypothetical protein